MEANNKNSQLFNTKEYGFSFYSYPKYNPYFGNDISATKTDNPTMQREEIWDKNYPYRTKDASDGSSRNIMLLTPAIFGGLGAFMVSFLLRRRMPRENRVDEEVSGQYLETHPRGFYKLELFLNVLSIIALAGCTAYVYEEIKGDGGIRRFAAVVPTVIIIIFLFASEHFLLYTVCPGCYEGVAGNSAVGDFLNLVALSVGAISVGESYGITAKTTGTKVLLAQESLFNLFVLALLISFIV
ncbi:hypothetical protein [Desulfosporosinus sp. OT]|uniref:hypothetical protein n=1 Tax=Desulfosporosinus sp. OT TaxID=913865 RepID=UPI0002239ED3|nr:hypothetical protein [Desulfosporosinus sp. OT]EGW37301.1 putative membrane protein [Desulfosporosinus sp. OT]